MRLWSLHPKYLDPKGLVALWREGLLAQAVLADQTRGYKHHPQLTRFRESPHPRQHIAAYLKLVYAESVHRGYRFNKEKIGGSTPVTLLIVSTGQLEFEWSHLVNKLKTRDPAWLTRYIDVEQPEPHPLFRVITGDIAEWEIITLKGGSTVTTNRFTTLKR